MYLYFNTHNGLIITIDVEISIQMARFKQVYLNNPKRVINITINKYKLIILKKTTRSSWRTWADCQRSLDTWSLHRFRIKVVCGSCTTTTKLKHHHNVPYEETVKLKVTCLSNVDTKNKRAQRALGRSPEEKVKGHSESSGPCSCIMKAYFLTPWPTYATNQNHLNNFGRGPPTDHSCWVWSNYH